MTNIDIETGGREVFLLTASPPVSLRKFSLLMLFT